MDITWLGHAATRVRTRSAAVVMDPYDRSVGGTMGRPDAHIITISHQDPLRNGVAGVAPADGAPMVLDGPGEYEIRGVLIESVRASLRQAEGRLDAHRVLIVIADFPSVSAGTHDEGEIDIHLEAVWR
mgnify:CR=1 FL=1